MRSFWGLMRAYWVSDRWKEAWTLTLVIALLTAAASKTSVWFAEASGELVNVDRLLPRLRATRRRLASLLANAGLLVLLVVLKDVGFTGIRNLFSATLHRKWRGWLDSRFNEALLDPNHTHYHLQQRRATATGGAAAPDNIDQRVQESIKDMTGGAIGLAMGVVGVVTSLYLRRPEAAARTRPRSTGWNSSAPMAAPSLAFSPSPSTCR